MDMASFDMIRLFVNSPIGNGANMHQFLMLTEKCVIERVDITSVDMGRLI